MGINISEHNVKSPLIFINTRLQRYFPLRYHCLSLYPSSRVPSSSSSAINDTWMKKFKILCYMSETTNMTRSPRMTALWFVLEESKYLVEIDVPKTDKNVRTSKVEAEPLSF